MAIARSNLIAHLDDLLEAGAYRDYGPNGLQIEGTDTITSIATGCTASLATITAALDAGCNALLVHHGLFWGKGSGTITGMLKPRVAKLLAADCNLIAYHLPLDGQPELGNNAIGLKRLGITAVDGFASGSGAPIGHWGRPDQPLTITELQERCATVFKHEVIHCPGGPAQIATVGMVSGGGQSFLADAAAAGCDVLITGETSEQSWHEAAELGIHLLACGHHATESIAIHLLGERLANEFDLMHHVIAETNPL